MFYWICLVPLPANLFFHGIKDKVNSVQRLLWQMGSALPTARWSMPCWTRTFSLSSTMQFIISALLKGVHLSPFINSPFGSFPITLDPGDKMWLLTSILLIFHFYFLLVVCPVAPPLQCVHLLSTLWSWRTWNMSCTCCTRRSTSPNTSCWRRGSSWRNWTTSNRSFLLWRRYSMCCNNHSPMKLLYTLLYLLESFI